MLTAKEARAIAGPTLEEKVEALLGSVKKNAEAKKRSLRTGYDHKEDGSLWETGGYTKSEEWFKAKELLESLGYKVNFYYSDGSFAVDMYTLVEW